MPKRLSIYLLAACLTAPPLAGADTYGNPGTMGSGAYGAYEAGTTSGVYGTGKAEKPVSYGTAISEKLGAGFANVVLCPLEIPKNAINTTNSSNLALGITGGILKGVLHMSGRMISGIFDVVSFPVPTETTPIPEYVWEDYTVDTHYGPVMKMRNLQ